MSRMGNQLIPVPSGVKATVSGRTVSVEGPKGRLSYEHRPEVTVTLEDSAKVIKVRRRDDSRASRAFHGLTRALVANMVEGVSKGYEKTLEIYGAGFNVKQEGKQLALNVGYANTVRHEIPMGVVVEVKVPQSRTDTTPAVLTISGADKQVVGQFAATVRQTQKPEPYKGKGIRYQGEHVRRKAGKAFGAVK